MTTMFRCECGQELRGNSDEELLAAVARHLARTHRDLPAALSREAVLAMAVESSHETPPSPKETP